MISDPCRDMRHLMCAHCECQCHAEQQLFDVAAKKGELVGIRPALTRDLLAHLRSGIDGMELEQAARTVAYVIDLGWRPRVGP